MTQWAPWQIVNIWSAARSPSGLPFTTSSQDVAASVAEAESGGTDHAISPSSDYGLWQIHLPLHLGAGGITWTNWMTPYVNARAAWEISTGGTNWGPWCTCWATESQCASGRLALPQQGSVAAYYLASLYGVGTTAPAPAPPPPTPPQLVWAQQMFAALAQWVLVDSVELYQVAVAEAQAAAQI